MHWSHICWITCTFLSITRHRTYFKGSPDLLKVGHWKESVSQIFSLLVTSHKCRQFLKFHSTIKTRPKITSHMIFPLISMLWMLAVEAESLATHASTPSKGLSPRKRWIDIWKILFSTNYIWTKSCMDNLVPAPTRFTSFLFKFFFLGTHLSWTE